MEASAVPQPRTDAPEPRPLKDLVPSGRAGIAVAVAGPALLAASFADFGASSRALVGAVLCPALVLLAAIDWKHRVLPNLIVLPAVLLVALVLAATDAGSFLEHLYAGLALFGFLFVFAAVFPAGLGMGDAKAGLLLGLALGARTLSGMMAAFAGLFVAALWILARHGLSARKQSLPFGPFLAFGGILGFFFG